jgi:hypothetical protein
MFSKLSEPQVRTLGFVVAPVVVVASTLLAYGLGGYGLTVIVALVATIVTALLSRALTPPWFGRLRSQVYSLAVLSAATLAVLAPDTLWIPILESLFKSFGLQPPSVPGFGERAVVLVILACAVIVLNFIWSRHQITPPSDVAPGDVDSKFSNSGYQTLRDEFCNYMVGQLDQYDRDVHWSDSDYRPLEAEVEIDRQGGRRPKVARDLIKAIHEDRTSRAFLLLGDPGSGKSVSLRRLCRELYAQVQTTGIVPVYVNLREWDGPPEPSDADISSFLLRHLKLQSGRSGIKFLETWFEGMLDRGLFFFILDSFDEMPAVLDCDDASNRLQTISKGFDRFFNDLHRCRGLLSSRFFRQPRGFRGRRLTIRPFSETQVRGAMRRWLLGQPLNADQVLLQLFREKPEFSSIVRNPFSADLVAQFLAHNPGQLPESYFSVFEDYVTRRLKEDTAGLRELELDPNQVLDSATNIAWEMYRAEEVGLDVEVNKLHQLVNDSGLGRHLTALRISRLARLGGLRVQRFSFAHRRFAEFFVVRKLMSQGTVIPLESIPSDSRWRDCLVVYCGIAPEAEARRLAEFSWTTFRGALNTIESGDLVASRPAIHCLRFLIDSFRGRLECTSNFRNELSDLLQKLLKNDDILVSKIAAEGLCLATDATREDGLAVAVERGIGWISETAIRSCRHFGRVSERSQKAIKFYIGTLPSEELFRRFKDLSFSLSLSEGFRRIRACLIVETFSIPIVWMLWFSALVQLLLIALNPEASSSLSVQTVKATPLATAAFAAAFSLFLMPILLELFLGNLVLQAATAEFQKRPRAKFAQMLLRRFRIRLGFDTSVRVGILFSIGILVLVLSQLGIEPDGKPLRGIILPAMLPIVLSLPLLEVTFELALLIVSPKKLLHRIAQLFSNWKELGSVLGILVLAYGLIGGIGWLLYKMFGKGIFWVFGVIIGASVVYMGVKSIFSACFASVHDWKHLRTVEIPENLTRQWVYQMCAKLKSQWGRKRFLDVLLVQGARVEDAPVPLPAQPWVNSELREKFAKLEEKWIGLEL